MIGPTKSLTRQAKPQITSSAPTGRHSIAQGIALGHAIKRNPSPEGASFEQSVYVNNMHPTSMDPITALATITQLLGLFVQERQGQADLNRQEFMDWLEAHRHEEIKNLISNTYHLSTEVDDILRADHAQILNELSQVNGTLAQVMSRLSSFGALAATLAPNNTLSDFATAALCHFEETKEKNLMTLPDGSGVQFGNSGAIKHEDPRFLGDDMDALEECGFIKMAPRNPMTLKFPSYAVYSITRKGAEYAVFVRQQQAEQNVEDDVLAN